MGGVQHDAGDINEAGVVQAVYDRFMQPSPYAALDQITNLRWAVDFDMPKHGGKVRHAQPLTST